MDIINEFYQAFFNAYPRQGVLTKNTPKEIIESTSNNGWYNWKPIQGTLKPHDYEDFIKEYSISLPNSFIEWHSRFYFADCDCSIIRLPHSLPNNPFYEIKKNLEWSFSDELIKQRLIPFADEGNDLGPLVFDYRKPLTGDIPIRCYDHEYGGSLEGLSEIIFSSFDKLLECLTFFLSGLSQYQNFELIPKFFDIDPPGAGKSGKHYWTQWVDMMEANFNEFGY